MNFLMLGFGLLTVLAPLTEFFLIRKLSKTDLKNNPTWLRAVGVSVLITWLIEWILGLALVAYAIYFQAAILNILNNPVADMKISSSVLIALPVVLQYFGMPTIVRLFTYRLASNEWSALAFKRKLWLCCISGGAVYIVLNLIKFFWVLNHFSR